MALEFKPSIPSLSSMAGYGANAVDLLKQASDSMNSGLDSIINTVRDTADADATRAMMMAYDKNNPMSINDIMPYIASAFPNARASTLEKLNTTDRILLNEQADKDNLLASKLLMAPYQAKINAAVAATDVAGTKRANEAATQVTDALGRPIRTDAYTLGDVDPLLNSASQRAVEAANVRKLAADMQKEALEFNRTNAIKNAAYLTAKYTPAPMWGTAQGNQANLNTAQTFVAQYNAQHPESPLTEADAPIIATMAKTFQEDFKASGQDPLQLLTPDYNKVATLSVDPITGQMVTSSTLYNAAQSPLAQQSLAAQQEAIAQQQEAQERVQQRAIEDRAFRSLVQQVGQTGSQFLITNEGRKQYNDLNPKQRKVVDLLMKERALQQEIAQAQQEQQKLTSAPYGYVDRQALDKATERVMSLAQQQKQLQAQIASAKQAEEESNQVDVGRQLLQNAGFSKQDQAALGSWLGAERQNLILRSSNSYKAMKAAVDPSGLADRAPEFMDAVYQVREAVLGLDFGDIHPLIKLTDRDGNALTPEAASNADLRDYAISLDKKYADMDGDSNLSWKEPDEILEKIQQIATKVKASLGSYKNLNISKKQYDALVNNLAVTIADAAIHRNQLPGSAIYKWDFDPEVADQLAGSALAVINNKDALFVEMQRRQMIQDKNAQALLNAAEAVQADQQALYNADLHLQNVEQNAKLQGLGDSILSGPQAALYLLTKDAAINRNEALKALDTYNQGR